MSRDRWWALSFLVASVVLAVLQELYPVIPPQVGWPIVGFGGVGAIAMFVRGALHKDNVVAQVASRKAEAQAIHQRIIVLDLDIEKAASRLTDNVEWREDPTIREALDKLQTELNSLGYLVNKSEYDQWAEDFMLNRAKELEFHQRVSDSEMNEWGRARVNTILRGYVRRVRN